MKTRRLGIDLSTTKSGWCFVEIDNETNNIEKAELGGFELKNRNFDYRMIEELYEHLEMIIFLNGHYDEIYIEIGNFGNPSTTQKFAYVAGIISTHLYNFHKQHNFIPLIKCVNPSAWFNHVLEMYGQTNKHYKREDCKFISLQLCKNYLTHSGFYKNVEDIGDDQADAFWIAMFGHKCYSYFYSKQMKKKEGKVKSNDKKRSNRRTKSNEKKIAGF